ncbi:MAG: hypothetical protein ACI8PZ_005989 [Myxococcota bacterium]|jgi:hypothetical protein
MSWTLRCSGALALTFLLAAPPALAGAPRASSELKDLDGTRHPASNAFDGLLTTAWAEGESGQGEGAWIELRLDRPSPVQSVSLWPGNMVKGVRSVRESSRPHTVTVAITVSGSKEPILVEQRVLDPATSGAQRVDIPIEGAEQATSVRITLDQVYEGGLYSDAYISEIALNFATGDTPTAVSRHNDWLASDSGLKAIAKNREEVVELFNTINAEDFGDRDSLQELMERASDGAPFLRAQVARSVPAGYRMHALPPDLDAVDALLKLKDSNAIPAIERAALRARGNVSRVLAKKAEYFVAFQEMVSGGRHNITPYGQTGWEPGALRGMGEPLDLTIDSFGGIYVADTGNNRVQRFSFEGIAEKQWGGAEHDVTDDWFGRTREYYASGSRPGTEPGEFRQPVSLARIPGKLNDTIVVLDASGRLSFIGPSGAVESMVQIDAGSGISGGVGGEGHLVYVKKRLVTIWGNEGFVHGLDGELLGQWDIKRGVPTSAVALPGAKLGLAFGRDLYMYSVEGFEYGEIFAGVLGDGFEAWDLCIDDGGKLWAVTDTGHATKFKKPGKVDFTVQVSPYSLEVPKIAVFDDLLFVTSEDHILQVDALEAKAEAAAAAAEAAE